jgi:hypothetical protein
VEAEFRNLVFVNSIVDDLAASGRDSNVLLELGLDASPKFASGVLEGDCVDTLVYGYEVLLRFSEGVLRVE